MPHTHCIITGFAVTSLLLLVGCNDGGEDFKPVTGNQPEVPEAAHHHEHGPNGGHVIELGDDEMYHAELVFDNESRKTTMYSLDGEVKSPVPIDATDIELHLEGDSDEHELMLMAVPLKSDGEGKSSRFELAGDKLPESIKNEEDIKGHLHVKIGDAMRNGDIEHDHDHGKEGHKHEDEKEDGDAPDPE